MIKKRNYGIDFLRILSMFMVVILHVLGQGGILDHAEPYSINYYVAWFFEIAAYCAVNCFAMISGYVMCFSKTKLSKISELWLQTVFYTLGILVLFVFIAPDTITLKSILNSVFPVTRKQYWYISSYFGLYLLIPVLNCAIQNISKKVFTVTLASSFLILSVLPTLLKSDAYTFNSGYSVMWLCLMYLFGGYIKRFDIVSRIKTHYTWITYLSAIILTLTYKIAMEYITPLFFGRPVLSGLFISYTSPTIVLASAGLFLACLKIPFSSFATKIISFLSPAALGVYLIHCNVFIWQNMLANFAKDFASNNTGILILLIFGSAIAIYLSCSIIELLRIQLFKLLRINILCQKIENTAYHLLNKLYIKFDK